MHIVRIDEYTVSIDGVRFYAKKTENGQYTREKRQKYQRTYREKKRLRELAQKRLEASCFQCASCVNNKN